MTLDESLEWAATWGMLREGSIGLSATVAVALAAEVRRLQSEVARLPARRAQPTAKTAPIAPTNWPAWGMIDETDEEFAARAGRKVTEDVG